MKTKRLATRAIHAGERQRAAEFIPVSTPIYSSSSFVYEKVETVDQIFAGERPGFTYSRHENPTRTALEEAVASLEEADFAMAFASGMAALHTALLATGIPLGSRVLAARDLYGVTFKLLNDHWSASGATVHYVDTSDPEAVGRELETFSPSVLLVETISNPLLRVCDLEALCAQARARGCRVIVDGTFATPVLARPLALGADLVVHSATKYLGGHGDVVGGVVAAREEYRQPLKTYSRLLGPVLGPFDAWLVRRGIKTLPLRMERHCANAARVAAWLETHPRVARVHYPGLASHPDHAVAVRLFPPGMYGGVVSFEIRDAGREDVFRFVNALRVCVPATTLGDIHSLLLYPAISSHRDVAPKMRQRLGIGDNLVRISVGLEDADDIQEDLRQALEK